MQTTVGNATYGPAINTGLNPIWVLEQVIMQYAERENLLAGYIGEGPDAIIQKITQLQKKNGDTVKVTLFSKLTSPGIDADATLEGNEDSLTPYQDTLLVSQKRNAVRLAGRLTEQRSAINLRKQAAFSLGIWARDFMTELLTIYLNGVRGTRALTVLDTNFTGFGNNPLNAPDSGHMLYAGSAGTVGGVTAADKMSTQVLDKAWAKTKLLINSGVPIKFPKVNGIDRPVVMISPEQFYDLQQDPDWVAAQQLAAERGMDNPLFTGASGFWKGMVIKENPAQPLFRPDGGNVDMAQAVLLGCQAGAIAFGGEDGATDGGGGRWRSIEKEFDYDNQVGYAVASILGVKKLQFNSKDNATFAIRTAYTSV